MKNSVESMHVDVEAYRGRSVSGNCGNSLSPFVVKRLIHLRSED